MHINHRVIVVFLVVVVVLAVAAMIAMLPPSQGVPAEPALPPDTANKSPFYEEIAVDMDRVVTRFVPWDPTPANYTLAYQVKRDMSGDYSLIMNATGASRSSPIEVVVPRQPGDEITVIVEIFNETGSIVHSSEGTYA